MISRGDRAPLHAPRSKVTPARCDVLCWFSEDAKWPFVVAHQARVAHARSPKRRRLDGQTAPIGSQDDATNDDSRLTSKQPSWAELLISKFPTFDPTWSDDVKTKWFDGFNQLMGKGKPE